MGLLASIVAYLSVVAAIVIGFLMSADAVINHSHHLTNPPPEMTTAEADSLKAKKAAKPPRKTAELRAIPQKSIATDYRGKTALSNTRNREPHKRNMHEAQRRYWPLPQEHAAAPRAFGYAEESRFGGDPWRY